MAVSNKSAYVIGHDERERRRPALQASILNPFTEHLLHLGEFRRGCESWILVVGSETCRYWQPVLPGCSNRADSRCFTRRCSINSLPVIPCADDAWGFCQAEGVNTAESVVMPLAARQDAFPVGMRSAARKSARAASVNSFGSESRRAGRPPAPDVILDDDRAVKMRICENAANGIDVRRRNTANHINRRGPVDAPNT